MYKDAVPARRLRRRPAGIVGTVLRGLQTATSAAAEWTSEVETRVDQVDKYWRLVTRRATAEELLRWTAGELGDRGAMYLKNLLLTELRNLREVENEVRKLATGLTDGEIAELLAQFRDELGGDAA